jgi:fatty acid-binding protein DegV
MNGTIEIAEKYASKKKAVLRLYDKLRQEGVNLKDFPIGISYVDDKENAEMLRDKILEVVGEDAMVWLQPMSPVVALQLGQGAIVLSYHVSKKKY